MLFVSHALVLLASRLVKYWCVQITDLRKLISISVGIDDSTS